MTNASPSRALAGRLAENVVAQKPRAVRRFRTGSAHFVYEVLFDRHAPLVVRMAASTNRHTIAGALTLSQQLRTLGVPLPQVIAANANHEVPYLVLERLHGVDLGVVIRDLPHSRLTAIATRVAVAQSVVARVPSAGTYGFAVRAADAPRARWHQVLTDNLQRSRARIRAAGLFDTALVDAVEACVMANHDALDRIPPVAFLHDTTTKNVIVTEDGRFSGLVDVDDLCFGDPRYVVALTQAALLAANHPLDYVDAWMDIAAHRVDAIFHLYVALFLIDLMSEHGQTFNKRRVRSSAKDRQHLRAVCVEFLKKAGAAGAS